MINSLTSFVHKAFNRPASSALLASNQCRRMALMREDLTRRCFATAEKQPSTKVQKKKSHGVYLWAKMPRLGAKGGAVSTTLSMPKGMPSRITEFDELNV